MIAAFATGKLEPIMYHSLYFDFLIVVSCVTFIFILLKVRYNLHMVETKLKHQVSLSFGNGNSSSDVRQDSSKQQEIQKKAEVNQQTFKKLRLITKTRIRMDVAAFLIVLVIPGTC